MCARARSGFAPAPAAARTYVARCRVAEPAAAATAIKVSKNTSCLVVSPEPGSGRGAVPVLGTTGCAVGGGWVSGWGSLTTAVISQAEGSNGFSPPLIFQGQAAREEPSRQSRRAGAGGAGG